MSSEPCNITSPSSQLSLPPQPSLPSSPPLTTTSHSQPPFHTHTMDTDWCLHCSRRFDGGLQGALLLPGVLPTRPPQLLRPLPVALRPSPARRRRRTLALPHSLDGQRSCRHPRLGPRGLPRSSFRRPRPDPLPLSQNFSPKTPLRSPPTPLASLPLRRFPSHRPPGAIEANPSTPPSSSHPLPHRSLDGSSITTSLLTDSVATPVSTLDHPLSQKTSLLGALATHVRSWVAPTRLPAKPDRASHGPSIHGVDPPAFTVFARAHRGPLAVLDEDILPSAAIGKHDDWDNEGDLLAGWYASRVVRTDDHKPKVPFRPTPAASPLDIDDHPAFRTRGRKPSRAYPAASSFYAYA